MDVAHLEALIRADFEPLQYAVFFGALVALGTAETLAAQRREGTDRRRRWPANFALTALNILVLGALPVGALALADLAQARGWGALNALAPAPVLALAAGLLLRSLVSYATHVAMHKLPPLWRVHRVHHTDTQMDVSTTVRFHPLEFLIQTPVALAATLALGIPPLAVLVYELADAAMAVFTHANLRLPPRLERLLSFVLVTPAMHRIHHSAWQPETDSNYGATLSVWDRLFGTYRARPPAELAALRLGLDGLPAREAASLARLLTLPFRRLRTA